MRPGTVSLADIKFVPPDVFPAIKRYRIFKEDIFISVAGTLGIVGKVPPELDGANLTENADRITK
jgi:type I restriction enzyme S subunit